MLNDVLNRSFLEKWAEVLVWQLWLVYDELVKGVFGQDIISHVKRCSYDER